MNFTKAQTNGNDFIIIEGKGIELTLEQKRRLADRKFGVGCDQIIFIEKKANRFLVNFFNQDGSSADMCGNGACAIALYIKKQFKLDKVELEISGKVYKTSSEEDNITVSFPMPRNVGDIITTGNKHRIFGIDETKNAESLAKLNPDCNLHFVEKISDNSFRVKTFERGVGWTLACGSGAIASGFHSGISGKIRIIHDGGESFVENKGDHIDLTTKPKLVFEGKFYA